MTGLEMFIILICAFLTGIALGFGMGWVSNEVHWFWNRRK